MSRAVACALVCATLFVANAHGGVAKSRSAHAAQATDTTRVALPDPVLAPDMPRALAVLDSARAAASADRHADAIRLYQRAIKLYPPLADEIGVEIGNQYTWADQPDSAMTWYKWHLARHPDDADAIIGAARLTSWRDDVDGAEQLYDQVLAADSTNLDARMGKAQVTNWSGRHRAASAQYRAILADYPDNVDARAGLMQAMRWMGRPDSAVALADSSPAPVLDNLKTDIERERAPGITYMYERNKDSDDIHRWYHTIRAGYSFDWLTRASAYYGHARFEQPGRPDVSRDWFGAVLERRISTTLALSANVGYQLNSYDRSALGPESYWLDEFNLFTYDVYATITPRDWTRIDVGLNRGPIDNPDAIFRGISRTEFSAGLDQRLRSNLVWISSLEAAWYNDGNSSFGLATRAHWQPLWRMPVKINHRLQLVDRICVLRVQEHQRPRLLRPATIPELLRRSRPRDDVFAARARSRRGSLVGRQGKLRRLVPDRPLRSVGVVGHLPRPRSHRRLHQRELAPRLAPGLRDRRLLRHARLSVLVTYPSC